MKSKRAILFIGSYLSAQNHTKSVGEELADRLSVRGWRVKKVSAQQSRFLRVLEMLAASFQRKYTVAVIEVYSGWAFVWAELVAFLIRVLKKPFILALHGGNLPNFSRGNSRRVRQLLKLADAVVSPTAYLAKNLETVSADIKQIQNGIDLSRYDYRLRSEVCPRLIWLRAFHSIYNPEMAIKVMGLLASSGSHGSLLMVGPDKGDGSFQKTQSLVGKIKLKNKIDFALGVPKEKVPEILKRGDIFINTTNIDNTPVSVIEAMACGMCIVSTNVGGIPYLLEHEKDALLVPPNDPEAMAQAVRRILTEQGLAERLSQNARKKAEQYDWAQILPQWEALLSAFG